MPEEELVEGDKASDLAHGAVCEMSDRRVKKK